MRHAVILAGGAGKRLWPLSRLASPKQLLPLIDGKSLLEIAVDRLKELFPIQNTWIITHAGYADAIAKVLPQVPKENIIGEPEGRDTANAITLAAELLAGRDNEATMDVFTADHVIRPLGPFVEAVGAACEVAEQEGGSLVTFGLRPTWPHTGLGYIEAGKKTSEHTYEVLGFKEKPDHQTARRYVDSGTYYWNSGMFVWTVASIRSALEQHLPDSLHKLTPVEQSVREGRAYDQLLQEVYPTLDRISIDYAVMEKAQKVLMVELKCEWLDVGSWPALENVTEVDDAGNNVVAENTVVLDSFRNIIVSGDDHLIAVLGMDDCIVIHAPDATLVCSRSDSQHIKEMVQLIEKKYGQKYL